MIRRSLRYGWGRPGGRPLHLASFAHRHPRYAAASFGLRIAAGTAWPCCFRRILFQLMSLGEAECRTAFENKCSCKAYRQSNPFSSAIIALPNSLSG